MAATRFALQAALVACVVAWVLDLQRSLLGPDLAEAFYGDDRTLADADMKRLSVLRAASMR